MIIISQLKLNPGIKYSHVVQTLGDRIGDIIVSLALSSLIFV
jgi:hypothetical protein